MKEFTTITVQNDTRKKLQIIKIKSNAKSLDETIRNLLRELNARKVEK